MYNIRSSDQRKNGVILDARSFRRWCEHCQRAGFRFYLNLYVNSLAEISDNPSGLKAPWYVVGWRHNDFTWTSKNEKESNVYISLSFLSLSPLSLFLSLFFPISISLYMCVRMCMNTLPKYKFLGVVSVFWFHRKLINKSSQLEINHWELIRCEEWKIPDISVNRNSQKDEREMTEKLEGTMKNGGAGREGEKCNGSRSRQDERHGRKYVDVTEW